MSTTSASNLLSSKKEASTSSSAKKSGDDTGVTLSFPPIGSDPISVLQHFKDENSNYAAVAKACLQLTQYAGCHSSASIEDSASVASSYLFHDVTYVDTVRASFQALMECVQQHEDRRCRILACKTLAILARSAYARIRPSPLLYSTRDTRLGELEDEIGAEVPSTLVAAVLDEADDGVSASAMEAIGIMILSTSPTVGTIVEDELQREIMSIGFARPSPYAPSLRSIVDEDPAIPLMELTTRILDNIMSPRLIQLVERIALYKSSQLTCLALPTLTACLVHHVKTTPSLLSTMDRTTYAKRWAEVDAIGLVDAVLQGMILPAMQPTSLHGSVTACQAALRLAHVCPHQRWVQDVCRAAMLVLKQELSAPMDIEQKIGQLALLVVAARGIPLMERTEYLIWATNIVATLPSTTQAPFGVSSAGALVELEGHKSYRRPARTGLLTEIALSLFMDGPVEGGLDRQQALEAYFSGPSISKILSERNRTAVIPLFDELLLIFSLVAVETGRRFRFAPDGSPLNVDTGAAEVKDWLTLARTVLRAFIPCVILGQNTQYLEESLSLLTAGEASYVRLVQLYLHTVGLLNADSSIAFKLAANACPPHLLWNPLSESSLFHSRFEVIHPDETKNALSLMDEFVVRETKQGLASHHMRIFLLTLAADTWVEGRMLSICKHLESESSLSLRLNSARAIAIAIGPKRLIAKIYEGHVPPVDSDGKKKRDPIKTLAKEAVRASVAAIENIALVACSWRRRFGQSQETNLLVSFTVGLLQGKVDETPMNETMSAIMGPFCEVAIAKIQAEFQDDGIVAPMDMFPISELITQPLKPKIKPLVSNAKSAAPDTEKILRSHLMQHIQQVIAARAEQCILSRVFVDAAFSSARPAQWLRLAVPAQLESKDGRLLGVFCSPLAAWDTTVTQSSAASDAVALVTAYTPRRYFRYDGEDEYRITVLMRAYNTIPAELFEGMKLELGMFRRHVDAVDASSTSTKSVIESLGGYEEYSWSDQPLISSTTVYRQEIKSGEQLLFEVSLDPRTAALDSFLLPSIVYRNMPAEPEEAGAKWTGEGTAAHGDASTATGGESKSGEDDFQVKAKAAESSEANETEHATLQGESLVISPLAWLQPCPLVFFSSCWGDVSVFRMFWFSMPFRVAELKVAPLRTSLLPSVSSSDQKVAAISSLKWDGEAIPGGFATALWAFMTLHGSRILCCLVENENGRSAPGLAMHFRGDDRQSLMSIVASKATREGLVASLCPGFSVID